MASLTGNLVAETYKALLKTIDNDILTASEKQITDGLGGGSNVFIDSQGFLRANKYKVTNGLATQFLKADGSLDSNAYLTSITGAQVITALGYTPVTNQRTLTINGVTYNLTADRSWTVEGTAAVWGNITGTLSNQTDLQNALNAKYNVPAGTISQYIRGDGTLATFPTLPGGLPIGGTSGQILAKIDATDYNTHWIDNFATQTKNEVKLGQTLAKGAAVYVSSANGTNMIVSAASNTSEALSSKTFGLLETGGVTNDLVKCVTFGLLAGLDTSTAQAGDPVWLGVNGALIFGLANKPYAPKHLVYIGVVTRVQSNNGEIFVNVQNGFELKEIHDVYIADPANNHGLFYDISDGLWKNKSIATALGYTPQAQLDGTGFVKASGTTITYDNSTYLTTADAATTYQRLDKMVSTLLPSATEYPNSNAVINALALKANAANPVFTGNMSISGAEPKLFFVDTDNNPDYTVFIDSGIFYIYDQTNGATRFSIGTTGNISAGVGKSITADSFIKDGGTASQFLKADGTIDSNTYVASSALANYLLISTAASTYQRLDKMVSTLLPSSTEYPNSNAVINALALKADAANPVFTGNMTISGAEPKLFFVDTDQNPDYTVFVDSGFFYIYDQTAGATRFQINSSGNISTGVGKSITAGSFVKDGGTASQYLMADGSVSALIVNPVTGSGTTNYLPKWTSASALGNSLLSDNGTNLIFNPDNLTFKYINVNQATGSDGGFLYTRQGVNKWQQSMISSDADALSFYSYAVAYVTMSLRTNGNVIIGSQIDSGYKLDVNGTGRFTNNLTLTGGLLTAPRININAGTSPEFAFTINHQSTFPFGSTNGKRIAYYGNFSVDDNGLQFGYDTTDKTGIIAGAATSAGTGIDFYTYNGSSWGNRARLTKDGLFGIGTVSPSYRLQVESGGVASYFKGGTGGYSAMAFSGDGGTLIGSFTTWAGNIYLGRANGAIGTQFGSEPDICIASNGNVLINTTSNAGYKFDVNGTARFITNITIDGAGSSIKNGNELRFYRADNGIYTKMFDAGSLAANGFVLDNMNAEGFHFKNNGTTILRMPSSNNVAINSTSDGGFRFYVNGASSTWATKIDNTNGTDNVSTFFSHSIGLGIAIDSTLNDSNYLFKVMGGTGSGGGKGSIPIIYSRADGRTGFGTSTPNAVKVEILQSVSGNPTLGTPSGNLMLSQNGLWGMFFGLNGSTGNGWIQQMRADSAVSYNLMLQPVGGNVLIGTVNDAGGRLQVEGGSIRFNWANPAASNYIWINRNSSQDGGLLFTSNNALDWQVNNTGGNFAFYSYGASGNVFTLTRSSGAANFSSSVTATSFFESSDFRLKTLIESNPIVAGIEKLEAKLYEKNGKIELGYFAQDAELIMPYAVTKNEDGFLNLSYREVHTAKIARLEQRVAELEKQLNFN